jgi:hypothetical protein
MAIDLSENGEGFNDLKAHIGHKIVCVNYGVGDDEHFSTTNVAIECETCNCVLVDFDAPAAPKVEPEEKGDREVAE